MTEQRPLAMEMQEQADQLRALATLCHELDPRLANCLVRHAAILALRGLRAERIERELATANRTVREIALDAAEDAAGAEARACPTATIIAAMATRQRHARTIAAILAPVLRHPGQH